MTNQPNTRRVDIILHGWVRDKSGSQVHILDYPIGIQPDGYCVYARPDPENPDPSWEGIPDEKDFPTYEEAYEYGSDLAEQFDTELMED